jgi:hypothetical protein
MRWSRTLQDGHKKTDRFTACRPNGDLPSPPSKRIRDRHHHAAPILLFDHEERMLIEWCVMGAGGAARRSSWVHRIVADYQDQLACEQSSRNRSSSVSHGGDCSIQFSRASVANLSTGRITRAKRTPEALCSATGNQPLQSMQPRYHLRSEPNTGRS